MAQPRFKTSQTAALAVMDRKDKSPRASVGGNKPPPSPPPAVAAPSPSGGGTMLIRGVSAQLKNRLDRARASRGLRSVNDAVLAILDEGSPK